MRRNFKSIFFLILTTLLFFGCAKKSQQPNILLVFADQLRSQELSCYGGVNIQTPNMDRLANEGVMITNAISSYPICSPFRGMLLTGLYPMHSGISNNDHPINPELPSFAKACKDAGYNTAYIGKWHIDGNGRTAYIPSERRLGYDYWQVLECTHNYFKSQYYDNDVEEPVYWEGFDADAQTASAQNYIKNRDRTKPFFMTLSWGPPHDPYIAPQEYMEKVDPSKLILRKNVGANEIVEELQNNPRFLIPNKYVKSHHRLRKRATDEQMIRKYYAGYLAATMALDDYLGRLYETLEEEGILDNTIVVFTSDHGDHHGSHGFYGKNTPYIESISIPLIMRYPKQIKEKTISGALVAPIDILPTVFGMANLKFNEVDGKDLSSIITKKEEDTTDAVLLMGITHFNNTSLINGLDTYRGVQTKRYTYARYEDKSPWLLFDNINDPYQMRNLVSDADYSELIKELDIKLDELLLEAGDPENTKLIYDRIIKENPERQLLLDLREVNPGKI